MQAICAAHAQLAPVLADKLGIRLSELGSAAADFRTLLDLGLEYAVLYATSGGAPACGGLYPGAAAVLAGGQWSRGAGACRAAAHSARLPLRPALGRAAPHQQASGRAGWWMAIWMAHPGGQPQCRHAELPSFLAGGLVRLCSLLHACFSASSPRVSSLLLLLPFLLLFTSLLFPPPAAACLWRRLGRCVCPHPPPLAPLILRCRCLPTTLISWCNGCGAPHLKRTTTLPMPRCC